MCGIDPVRDEVKVFRVCPDCRHSSAFKEGYGQVVAFTVAEIAKMKGLGEFYIGVVSRIFVVVFVDAHHMDSFVGNWMFNKRERRLRSMPARYPGVDYHADEGNECSHPSRRGPRETSHPMHNGIFSQKINTATATVTMVKNVQTSTRFVRSSAR